MPDLDPWYLHNLVCPLTKTVLVFDGKDLVSEAGRRYPVVEGIPVLLLDDVPQTHGVARTSLDRAAGRTEVIDQRGPEYYLETLGISSKEKEELVRLAQAGSARIDPVALMIIGATSGSSYKHLIGNPKLSEYPIPKISLPPASGALLLDLGCNWGRWSISAARSGYSVVGLDPSLGAVLAARRIARDFELDVKFVVGDGRFLPFRDAVFDCVYSYSVVQHFSKEDTFQTLRECARILKPNAIAKVQMANACGIRSFQHQVRRKFREARDFEVRYWTVPEMRSAFERTVGPVSVSTDCYFGLGWQWSDFRYMRAIHKPILLLSEALRRLSNWFSPLRFFADSVFCTAVKSSR